MNQSSESTTPTPWAVICPDHGRVYLSREEYDRQMDRANHGWECPRFEYDTKDPTDIRVGPCGADSEFDDETYETESPP